MAASSVKCASCGTRFQPKRSTARYCKPACREKARRTRAAAAAKPAKKSAPTKKAVASKTEKQDAPKRKTAPARSTAAADNHALVIALRKELEDAGALDTFEGQLALELARRLVTPGEGASSLADKVRAARAAALGQAKPGAGGDDPKPPAEEDDEVTRARTRRKEARQAAGLP